MYALIAEAVALCDVAQQEFERINIEIQRTIQQSRELTASALIDEERAHKLLFGATARLGRRVRKRNRLLE